MKSKAHAKRRSPKSISSFQRLNRGLFELDRAVLDYESLLTIKSNIVTGTLTADLYKFLNKNGSMESLLHDLPSPETVPEASLEDLSVAQNHYIDVAIEGLGQKIIDLIKKVWESFKNWVLDWIDTNRRLKFRLQRHLRKITESLQNYGGDPASYAKIEGMVYSYKEWKQMRDSAVELHKLLETVSQNEPAKWFSDNFNKMKELLTVLGYKLNTSGNEYQKVVEDVGPKASKHKVNLFSAGWKQDNLKTSIEEMIGIIENEEKSRGIFIGIQRAFDRIIGSGRDADKLNIAAFRRLLTISKIVKGSVAASARALNDVLNIALRSA